MMIKMNCSEVRARLSAYQDHELDAALLENISLHLNVCRECARELELLDAVTATVRALPQSQPPSPFTALVMGRILEKEKKPRLTFIQSFVYSMVVIVCFGLGILLNSAARNSMTGQDIAQQTEDALTQVLYQSQTLSLSEVQESSLDILLVEKDSDNETS